MAFKLSINRGDKTDDIAVADGTTISGNDGLELNIDRTSMSKGEALILIDQLKHYIERSPWPIPTA